MGDGFQDLPFKDDNFKEAEWRYLTEDEWPPYTVYSSLGFGCDSEFLFFVLLASVGM